jgi:hypothetical protein
VYSAASAVNGTNLTADSRGFGLPEYFGFGTIVTLPVVLKLDSFHGPSTTDHSGLDAYVLAIFDWAVRNAQTALQCAQPSAALSVVQPPLPGLAFRLVTSQAIGMGVSSASWL